MFKIASNKSDRTEKFAISQFRARRSLQIGHSPHLRAVGRAHRHIYMATEATDVICEGYTVKEKNCGEHYNCYF